MRDMVLKLDEMGRPAWLGLMVVSFILFWPLGLAVLAFLLWSGRMGHGWGGHGWGCSAGDRSRWKQKFAEKWDRHGPEKWSGGFPSSGNRAFDEYREETLKQLEDEQRAFREFLERLRLAKDRAEFDQFMAERKSPPTGEPSPGSGRDADDATPSPQG